MHGTPLVQLCSILFLFSILHLFIFSHCLFGLPDCSCQWQRQALFVLESHQLLYHFPLIFSFSFRILFFHHSLFPIFSNLKPFADFLQLFVSQVVFASFSTSFVQFPAKFHLENDISSHKWCQAWANWANIWILNFFRMLL